MTEQTAQHTALGWHVVCQLWPEYWVTEDKRNIYTKLSYRVLIKTLKNKHITSCVKFRTKEQKIGGGGG